MENKKLSACQQICGGYAIYVKAVAELRKSRRIFIYNICECIFLL